MPIPSPSRPVALAIVLAALVAREAFHEARSDGPPHARIDDRFAPLVAAAKGEARIGFVTTPTDRAEYLTRRVHAQYALAPSVLLTGPGDGRLVLGWSDTADGLERLAAEHRMRPIARLDGGYALFDRRAP